MEREELINEIEEILANTLIVVPGTRQISGMTTSALKIINMLLEKEVLEKAETLTVADAVSKLVEAFEGAALESKEINTGAYTSIEMIGWKFSVNWFYPLGEIPDHVFALYNTKPGKYELAKRSCLEDLFIGILEGDDDSAK